MQMWYGAGFFWIQIQGLLGNTPFISYNTKKILWDSSSGYHTIFLILISYDNH